MEYCDYLKALAKDEPALAAAFKRDSIENVLDWMQERNLPSGCIDMIAQDEFSYDFLIHLQPEDRWLVFGVN